MSTTRRDSSLSHPASTTHAVRETISNTLSIRTTKHSRWWSRRTRSSQAKTDPHRSLLPIRLQVLLRSVPGTEKGGDGLHLVIFLSNKQTENTKQVWRLKGGWQSIFANFGMVVKQRHGNKNSAQKTFLTRLHLHERAYNSKGFYQSGPVCLDTSSPGKGWIHSFETEGK